MKWIEDTAYQVLRDHCDQSLKCFATGCIMLELIHKLLLYMKNHFDENFLAENFLAEHHYCCCLLVRLMKPSPDMDNETCKEFEFIQSGFWTHRY